MRHAGRGCKDAPDRLFTVARPGGTPTVGGMHHAWRLAILVSSGAPLSAGMPSFTVSDFWSMRLQSISFFLMILAVSALAVMGLWNHLRRDFTRLPRLTYLRSLSLVVLLGLLF